MAVNIARRKFIAALGGAAIAWPHEAVAQQSDKMRLIGVLMGGYESAESSDAFLHSLGQFLPRRSLAVGAVEGQNRK